MWPHGLGQQEGLEGGRPAGGDRSPKLGRGKRSVAREDWGLGRLAGSSQARGLAVVPTEEPLKDSR